MSDEIAGQLVDTTYVLDEIAILGQLILLYSLDGWSCLGRLEILFDI